MQPQKCPDCHGDLVRSREWIAGNSLHWLKPWGSLLTMSVKVFPWACMQCGRVFLYLKNKEKIISEYSQETGIRKGT